MTLAAIDELTTLAQQMYLLTVGKSEEEKKKKSYDLIFDLLVMAATVGFESVFDSETDTAKRTPSEDTQMISWEDVSAGSEQYREDKAESADYGELVDKVYKHMTELKLRDIINKHIEGDTWTEENIRRVLETEYHRYEELGKFEGAAKRAEKTGRTAYKVWVTMDDDRVRLTHEFLEGVEVPLQERFYTIDGDSALYPGDFELPENVINCRCTLDYTFK